VVDRVYPSEALVSVHDKQSKAMADQITTVSKLRLHSREAILTVADMRRVERAVKVQLGLLDTL
jgi:mRNA interferase MazF